MKDRSGTHHRPCDRCGAPTDTALCPACRRRLSSALAGPEEDQRVDEARREPEPVRPPSPPTRTINSDLKGPPEMVSVAGSLVVLGRVGSGWRLEAVESLSVEGIADGADFLAGTGAVRLEGGCRRCDVRAGVARGHLIRASEVLLGIEEEIAMVVRMTTELRLAAAMRGTAVPVRDALEVVLAARAPHLVGRLDAALTILRAGRDRAGSALDPLLLAATTVRTALTTHTDLKGMARDGASLAEAVAAARWFSGQPPRSIVASMTGCEAEFAGDLVLRGQGAKDSEIVVGGDLLAAQKGTTVSGGVTRVSGRAMIDRLGGGPATELHLDGRLPGERLRVASVAAGVEIHTCDRSFAFAAERKNLVVTVANGRAEIVGV
jgi:hypothetical protein